MNDIAASIMISWKIIESLLLSLVVAGNILLCIIYFFQEKGEEAKISEKEKKLFERKVAGFIRGLILPLAILIFIGLFGKTPILSKSLLILTAGTICASSLSALLKKIFGLEREGGTFWTLFIIFYCVVMYIIKGEIIR